MFRVGGPLEGERGQLKQERASGPRACRQLEQGQFSRARGRVVLGGRATVPVMARQAQAKESDEGAMMMRCVVEIVENGYLDFGITLFE